jgi:uncharacterized protein (DUF488 family)
MSLRVYRADRMDLSEGISRDPNDGCGVMTVLTVGHSTRSIEAFLDLLRAQGVKRVIDVRTIPRSRHNPQFSRETLSQTLRQAGIGYTHLPELGGLRHAQRDSPNMGWRNTSFRGYADYMQTPEFEAGLDTLMAAGEREPIVVMCAEAVPWRCHRSLIADALSIRGIRVKHILSATRTQPHALTPFAQVHGMRITYPIDQLSLDVSSPGVPAVSVTASPRRTPARKGTRTRQEGPKLGRP